MLVFHTHTCLLIACLHAQSMLAYPSLAYLHCVLAECQCVCVSVSVEVSVYVVRMWWKCQCVSVSVEVSVFKGFSGSNGAMINHVVCICSRCLLSVPTLPPFCHIHSEFFQYWQVPKHTTRTEETNRRNMEDPSRSANARRSSWVPEASCLKSQGPKVPCKAGTVPGSNCSRTLKVLKWRCFSAANAGPEAQWFAQKPTGPTTGDQ